MNWFGSALAWTIAAVLFALPGVSSAEQSDSRQSGAHAPAADGPESPIWGDASGPWIAFAGSTTNSRTGFVYGQSERAAENAALEMCRERGGGECEVEFTLELGCAAVVSRLGDSSWAFEPTSIRHAVSSARRTCGKDCSVVWSGCTTPRSRRQGG